MQHRVQSDLKSALMTSTVDAFKTPEGFCFGAGTTVGNGIEGWAPSAIFADTDAGKVYVNTGTKTTATWSLIGAGQQTALTTAETTITNAGTASDYAIQAMTSTSPFGFVSQAEGETLVEVVLNNQLRINELETKLQATGLLA